MDITPRRELAIKRAYLFTRNSFTQSRTRAVLEFIIAFLLFVSLLFCCISVSTHYWAHGVLVNYPKAKVGLISFKDAHGNILPIRMVELDHPYIPKAGIAAFVLIILSIVLLFVTCILYCISFIGAVGLSYKFARYEMSNPLKQAQTLFLIMIIFLLNPAWIEFIVQVPRHYIQLGWSAKMAIASGIITMFTLCFDLCLNALKYGYPE